MKSRILLVLVLCAALLICGCGSPETVKEQQAETPVAGENEPTAAPEAGNEQQTEPPAADETEPTAAPEADYTGMTLEQIKALDAVDRDALMQYVLSRQDLPMEEIVASGLFDTEGLFEIIVERFPAMTIEEVMALDVFDPDAIGVLNMIRQDIISQNGGVDPAVPVEEPIDGVVVSLTLGTVSHETGYAVQGGDTLSTEEGSSLELALGGDNYIQLHANTQVTVHRQGEELRLEMSQGGLSFFFADAEQMVCSPVCVSSLCTIDMQSRCGFINRPAGALWIKVTPYAGQMTLRLNDGSTGIAADGVTTTVLRENEVDAGEAFSGKFEGMTDLILNHRQIADVLASAYEMSTAEVLLTAGIRTEPEIRIRDLGNGTYDRTVIDVNGDVVEDGRFNSADDSVLSNYLYQYDENHRVIREELIAPGNYWDGREIITHHTLMPYALKLFRQRWYIVGKPLDNDKILIFATDRISTLSVEQQTFKYPKDFDINDYYHDSFGIIIEEGVSCEHIVIKVASGQVKYLRTLPLHSSQQETTITPDYSLFEYDLKPTYDFEQEILSHREDFEVLKPISFRDRIKTIIGEMYKHYSIDPE